MSPSAPKKPSAKERRAKKREAERWTPEEEISEVQDDAVIGRAFRWSMVVIGGIAALFLALRLLTGDQEEAAPEVQLEAAAPEAVEAPAESQMPSVPFVDVAAEAGIDMVHVNGATGAKLLPETMGGGVAFVDYDGDGDQDLFFVNGRSWVGTGFDVEGADSGSGDTGAAEGEDADDAASEAGSTGAEVPETLRLYANDGSGNFEDVTEAAGLDISVYGQGVAIGDYDADGWTDLFVSTVGPNLLLRNVEGRFEDVTEAAGVAGDPSTWSTSSAFFDHDGDGDLDLFVGNYVRWSPSIDYALDYRLTGVGRAYGPPQNYEGTQPYLYRNEGDGRFSEVAEEAGLYLEAAASGLPAAKMLGLAPIDVDEDGDVDLLVANDTVRNFFFENQGDGRFAEVGETWGVAYDRNGGATGAMGVDSAYYRNDDALGFVVGNFANEMSSIYVSQGDPRMYVDESIAEGIGASSRRSLTFGSFFFDYDLDGRLDLLATNGHLEENINTVDPSQTYLQPAQLFWNAGDSGPSTFQEVPTEALGALGEPIAGRAAAYGDLDGDGDLDTVVTQAAGPVKVVRNDQALGHHWLRVDLRGGAPNPSAIGARVVLEAGGVTQRRQVMPTRSYLSQVELPITFGLGAADAVDALTVVWPDGSEQSVAVEGVDRVIVVEQAGAGD